MFHCNGKFKHNIELETLEGQFMLRTKPNQLFILFNKLENSPSGNFIRVRIVFP